MTFIPHINSLMILFPFLTMRKLRPGEVERAAYSHVADMTDVAPTEGIGTLKTAELGGDRSDCWCAFALHGLENPSGLEPSQ